MSEARRPSGLYRQLTLRLLLPMLILVATGGALGLYAANRQTGEVFDRWLLDAAVSLAQQVDSDGQVVSVDLPPSSQAMLAYDEIDQTFYAVERGGKLLAGVPGIPHAGPDEAIYGNGRAFDAQMNGQRVRVAAAQPSCSHCGDVTVLVAETLRKRQRAARGTLWIFSPMILLLLATMGAILMTVRRTVQPLERLADRWNREAHESLAPISGAELPRELIPFATALNDLLTRIRRMLVRERRFAATAAHQVRTPLAALRLGLDRARRAPDLEATRSVLAELDVSTEHTARMVQQLLLLGRLDPEHPASVELQQVDLTEIVREVCGAMSDLAFARNIDVELLAPETPVLVRAQSELIAEAVANLLDNALKATPPHGRIGLAITAGPAALSVTDSGPGIPLAERETIFEHFARGADASWAGCGLGLSIVRDIAKLHRAQVTVADAATAPGACFTLTFDDAAAPDAGNAAASAPRA